MIITIENEIGNLRCYRVVDSEEFEVLRKSVELMVNKPVISNNMENLLQIIQTHNIRFDPRNLVLWEDDQEIKIIREQEIQNL